MQTNDTTVNAVAEKKKPQVKDIIVTVVFSLFFAVFFLLCIFHKPVEYSSSERRKLDQFPKFTWGSVFENDKSKQTFMSKFDDYTLDQFPFRDTFRSIHGVFQNYVMFRKDTNGLAVKDNVVVKIDKELSEESTKRVISIMNEIYNRYLKDNTENIYFTVVPDKNYYFSQKYKDYLSMDYNKMVSMMIENLTEMEYIDIFGDLDLDDYYMTDTHWSQDKIVDVAKKLAEKLGVTLNGEYKDNVLSPFYGVYYGQAALPLRPDTIHYLTNDILDQCIVSEYNSKTGEFDIVPMYNIDKFHNDKDPYSMFISNIMSPYVRIENPNAKNDKTLVLFKDSFGCSIAPLLAEGYKTIEIFDIRAISPTYLGAAPSGEDLPKGWENYTEEQKAEYQRQFLNVDFSGKDVLFMYSTLIINESASLQGFQK